MNDQEFEQKIKTDLESWDDELSPVVAGKLRAARRDALSSSQQPRKRWLVPVVAFASIACVAIIAPRLLPQRGSIPPAPIDGIATLNSYDMSLLTAGEELELLENVEFMLWLSEMDDAELG